MSKKKNKKNDQVNIDNKFNFVDFSELELDEPKEKEMLEDSRPEEEEIERNEELSEFIDSIEESNEDDKVFAEDLEEEIEQELEEEKEIEEESRVEEDKDDSNEDDKTSSEDVEEKEIEEESKVEEDSNEEKVEEKEEKKEELPPYKDNKVYKENKGIHLNFETRVIIYVIVILALFAAACLLVLKVVNFGNAPEVTYSDRGSVSYQVCIHESDYYEKKCEKEGESYPTAALIDANFGYHGIYSEPIEGLKYYVIANTRVYDKKYEDKILYEAEDLVVDKTELDPSTNISIQEQVTIDYPKYNKYALNYYKKYPIDSNIDLEVALYIEDRGEARKVSSIVFPLGKNNFEIEKDAVNVNNQTTTLDVDMWNEENTIYVIIACVLIIIALILIFRVTCFVLKVTTYRSAYQRKVEELLSEYDSLIVEAEDSYEPNADKELIKVDTFEDLLKIKDEVDKPIIFSRVNDVKSEFIVEDEEKTYKYVLKETDF